MKTGFKEMSEFVPKVEVYKGGVYLQQSSLWIMREDFMDVVAVNVAFQYSLDPQLAGLLNLVKSNAKVFVSIIRTTPSHAVTAV
jgi:hypothetical protein